MENKRFDIREVRRQINNQKYIVHLFVRRIDYSNNLKHSVAVYKRDGSHWEFINAEHFDFIDSLKAIDRYNFIIKNFRSHMMESIL